MPGMTGTRSPTARTQVSSTCRFSLAVSVAPSPSEPMGTMPVQPLSTIQRAWSARKPWSMRRSSLNGVVMAGITPRNLIGMETS